MIVVLSIVTVAILFASVLVVAQPESAAAQALRGRWDKLGQSHKEIYHAFGASDGELAYLIGGIEPDGSLNRDAFVVNLVTGVVQRLQIEGILAPRAAAAGGIRVQPDVRAIYAIGGGETAQGGFLFTGSDTVQELDLKAAQVSEIKPEGVLLRNRLLHAAAYDPLGDRIAVFGGTRDCTVRGVGGPVEQLDCRADYDDVKFLQFDSTGGVPKWEEGPTDNGPSRLIGATLVYDPWHQRMLLFGGSLDGDRGLRDVFSLHLKPGEDPYWQKMSPEGPGPNGLFLHAAAMDHAHNRMVVYGGVSSKAFAPGENANDATWLLDIDPSDPERLKWRQCLGATTGEEVANTMVSDIPHESVVLMAGRDQSSGGPTRVTSALFRLVCEADTPPATPTGTPKITATATITPTATSTATPTATSIPTSTPTSTPTPTATPVPLPLYIPVALRHPCSPSSYYSDVALVLDLSTSMRDQTEFGLTKLEVSIAEAKIFAEMLSLTPDKDGRHDQLALVGFNKTAWIEQELTDSVFDLQQAADRLAGKVDYNTRLDLGLEYGAAALRSPKRQELNTPVIILLTDGLPDQVPYDPDDGTVETTVLKAADAAKQQGAQIYTIAIGLPEDTNQDLLREVASSPDMFYYQADAGDLDEVYSEIVGTFACEPGTEWPAAP
jgi:Mg-chelatase subunit ChlD